MRCDEKRGVVGAAPYGVGMGAAGGKAGHKKAPAMQVLLKLFSFSLFLLQGHKVLQNFDKSDHKNAC